MATERETMVEQLLSGLPRKVEPLARRVRTVIQHAAPGAAENADRGTASIAYYYETRFCTLRASEAGIELEFDDGELLPDLEGFLSGNDERSRTLPLRSEVELETPAVSALVEAAALRARDPGETYCGPAGATADR